MAALDHDLAAQELNVALNSLNSMSEPLRMLEAGGGSASRVNLPVNPHVTVIDISEEQLDRNSYAHVKILGDLHTVDIPKSAFDFVVCWDVVEHLANPVPVVEKLIDAVAPGGLLLIAAPNPRSLQGLVTKFTPHWFHVFVYRWLFGAKHAGEPGYPPFPTVLSGDMHPEPLAALAARSGCRVRLSRCYESPRRALLRAKSRLLGFGFDAVIVVGNNLVGGKNDFSKSDFFFVIERPLG